MAPNDLRISRKSARCRLETDIRVGGVRAGPVIGVLLMELLFGHLGFELPAGASGFGFALFIFGVGIQAVRFFPRLAGIDLPAEAAKLARERGLGRGRRSGSVGSLPIVRAYRVTGNLVGQAVAQLRVEHHGELRGKALKLRRGDKLLEIEPPDLVDKWEHRCAWRVYGDAQRRRQVGVPPGTEPAAGGPAQLHAPACRPGCGRGPDRLGECMIRPYASYPSSAWARGRGSSASRSSPYPHNLQK